MPPDAPAKELHLPDDWRSWPEHAKARLRWRLTARPEQLTPGTEGAAMSEAEWNIWLILAGRGYGKTRTGAEDVAWYAHQNPDSRIAIVAPTFADARDTCVEGESGLLAVLPKSSVGNYNRSMGELIMTNGSRFKLFSSDEPERLRGPQHHRAWLDELAAWNYLQDTWDMLMFGLRLGERPQVVATTTPKPYPLIRQLVARGSNPRDVVVQRGNTFDNASNLAPAAIEELKKRYEGTRIGRQELYAEVLEDVEGALWNHELLDRTRIPPNWLPLDLIRTVVAVDPAVSVGENADETGIIVAAKGICRWCGSPPDPHTFVLADRSMKRALPDVWARQAIRTYHEYKADRLVPEKNNGHEMVLHTLRTIDRHVNIKAVWASKGKRTRAEPVSALYEQGKVHHVGTFGDLEDQLCTWEPDPMDGKPSSTAIKSPDRLDALVWAVTDLMLSSNSVRRHEKVSDIRLVGRR